MKIKTQKGLSLGVVRVILVTGEQSIYIIRSALTTPFALEYHFTSFCQYSNYTINSPSLYYIYLFFFERHTNKENDNEPQICGYVDGRLIVAPDRERLRLLIFFNESLLRP